MSSKKKRFLFICACLNVTTIIHSSAFIQIRHILSRDNLIFKGFFQTIKDKKYQFSSRKLSMKTAIKANNFTSSHKSVNNILWKGQNVGKEKEVYASIINKFECTETFNLRKKTESTALKMCRLNPFFICL